MEGLKTLYAKNMDLDLASYIESVRLALYCGLPGDTYETVWRRRRDGRKKNCAFWRAMAIVLKKEMEALLEASLIHSFAAAYSLTTLLVHIFFYAVNYVYTAVPIDPRQVETNSDPPKIFIPIPKIESNGCARSDSLIRLLIF